MMKLSLRIARAGLAWAMLLFVSVLTPGCGKKEVDPPRTHVHPKVRVIRPQTRDLVRTVGQPGFIYAYEQTSLFPKGPGYIKDWKVDIGDPIRQDMVLATLLVPELNAEYQEKIGLAELDRVQIKVAEKWWR